MREDKYKRSTMTNSLVRIVNSLVRIVNVKGEWNNSSGDRRYRFVV